MPINLIKAEKLVLEIVQEYLNKNREFNVEKIIPFIYSRIKHTQINLNYQGIHDILKSLLKKKILVEGSKLSSDDVLFNEARRRVFNFILENPGTYFSKILKKLDLANHVVVWHLNMLLKFSFIEKSLIDNTEVYYEKSMDLRDVELIYFKNHNKSKKIIQYLLKNDRGVNKTKIAEDLNIHINTLSKYLIMLENLRIIYSEKIDKHYLYFLEETYQLNRKDVH